MKKLLVLLALVFLGICLSFLFTKSHSDDTYTVTPATFSKPVTIESKAQVIALVLNQKIFIKNDKTHCLNKVLFWSLKTGYVSCGHQTADSVYHVFGNENLPDKIYFSLRELNL